MIFSAAAAARPLPATLTALPTSPSGGEGQRQELLFQRQHEKTAGGAGRFS